MAGDSSRQNGKKGGRPKGSTTVPQLRDFVSEADRKEFVEFVLSTYKEDVKLTIWVGDHLFLKPTKPLDEESEAFVVAAFNFLKHERNTADDPANG